MKKEELIEYIEKSAPLNIQATWDCSGVQIESIKSEFTHLAVMLDPCKQSIEKALEINADFILAHHPLSMAPYRLNVHSPFFQVVKMLLNNNIFLYSAHTSLDSAYGFFASWLSEDLGLTNCQELDEVEHFGAIGSTKNPMSVHDVIAQLQKSMPFVSKKDFRLSAYNDKPIGKIAFCFGSGSSLYEIAKQKGADIFITGDVKYHFALDVQQNEQAMLLDVGHFCLEEEMMRRFAKYLEKQLPIKVSFIEGVNPFTSCANFEDEADKL